MREKKPNSFFRIKFSFLGCHFWQDAQIMGQKSLKGSLKKKVIGRIAISGSMNPVHSTGAPESFLAKKFFLAGHCWH